MRLKGKGKFVGGLVLAAGFALTGVVGVSAQQGQGEQGGGRGRAERPWGHGEGRGGGRRGGGFGRFGAELNLSDAQLEQMRQIRERYQATFEAQRQSRGEERRGFDPLSGAFDEGAVRAEAQARANAQVEREVAQARMMYEMYNVLTAEQKAQLQSARQQREQRREERRTRRGAPQTQLQ